MLTIFHATDQQALADQLLKECRDASGGNPLAEEVLIVQNHGMGQWLTMHRARAEGVAANMVFEFPAERMWKLVRLLHPDLPQTLPSDRGPMAWSLMQLLEEYADEPIFAPLRFYMEDTDPGRQEVRKWKLSNKIADVFDQYLVYRPDLLLKWEQGKTYFEDNEAERWQSEIWRKLQDNWKVDWPDEYAPHRALLQQELFDAIEEGVLDGEALPARLSVFGVSGMPPALVQTLVQVSALIDVSFYQLTTDRLVTDAADFYHPLLQSFGKVGSDLSNLLQQSVKRYGVEPNYTSVDARNKDGQSTFSTFLQVQESLKKNQSSSRLETGLSEDGSIRVHSCHSPMREVEILYDQLLSILDENPNCHPDDVLIMTPDIETYAPMIRAVFGSQEEGQLEIPFHISDRGVGASRPVTEAFLGLLALLESRFKVTELLDLLDTSPIRSAFEIREEEITQIEQWVEENRIRWGIDGPFKEKLGLPATSNFSWKAGLRRMILGYTMEATEDQLFESIYPYEEVASSDDAVLAGKLAYFLQSLFELYEEVQQSKSIDGWANCIASMVSTFFPDNQEVFSEVAQIRQRIDTLKEQGEVSGYGRTVPYRLIRSWFQNQLEEQHTGGGRIGQGITFSSLMPMRSIPFQVIGVIGMNDDAFPRPKKPVAFDLMSEEQRPGDPINAQEDRYLFLENLLSAGSHIYFSYVGQSNRDDTDFPPSVVLSEFLDYLETHHGLTTDSLITRHPLQAFSSRYFKDEGYFSYSKLQRKISQQMLSSAEAPPSFIQERLPPPDEEKKQLSLNQLISFYQHPIQYVMRNRLGIYLRTEEVITEDREPFALQGLDNYQVGQVLLDRYIKKKPLESYHEVLRSRDQLPEGWVGEQAYDKKITEVQNFATAISRAVEEEPLDDLEVNLSVGGFHIVGHLSNLYTPCRLSYRFGSPRAKDLISFWVKHVVLQTVSDDTYPNYSLFYAKDRYKTFVEYELSPVEDSVSLLERLLQGYWQGQQSMSYLFPESAFAFAEQLCQKKKEEAEAMKNAIRAWEPSYNGYPGEGDDGYIRLAVGSDQPLQEPEFQKQAVKFWAPFFEHVEKERG
ncbi:exodeoxyribonuclease V subunit gamma [Fodinibius salsisoli]|uniref:Exodeoxyribonuclease V subunit gamma n=1 Tax=Fodinibius salsisoli TaxID=2820877 RepID=A0ABT3PQV0_9BACT|nr:exodeoxyribonuclease V subunit gamma [Fodinibius salsisoli]MCW9708210.1 exodeoxyribonuclease V subunit gamma [Fodinibius salsisoli]